MKLHRHIITIAATLLLAAGFTIGSVHAQETLRPEIGKPLQSAQELLKSQKPKEALAKVREADAIGGKTAYESFIVERMRFAAAASAGETDVAAKALDTLIDSGKLAAADRLKFVQAVAVAYYRAKDYPKAIAWTTRYQKEGGSDSQMRTLLAQSYYLAGDYANAAKELVAEFQSDDKAGNKPSEDRLQMLASCALKLNDHATYASTLEKLVVHYPKKEYWADLVQRIQKKPGFADRLSLDVFRLKLASGNLGGAGDYMEMAQLALQQGYPVEAKKVVEQGYASNILGSGSDAERQKRLRDLVARQFADDQKTLAAGDAQAAAAKDGNALVNVGFNHALNGQYDKAIALIEQGIARGGLKHPDDAKLHLGIACLMAGQKAKAEQVLKSVQGSDGAADLARLWLLHAQRS
jgi:TolA-binding protein